MDNVKTKVTESSINTGNNVGAVFADSFLAQKYLT